MGEQQLAEQFYLWYEKLDKSVLVRTHDKW